MAREQESADFEDDRGLLNKERRNRNHVQKIYNKARSDFPSDSAFDDYLEVVEDLVSNLTHDVDVEATKARINLYKRDNQAGIGQNQARRMEARQKAAERLAREEREGRARLAEMRAEDEARMEEVRERRREREEEEMARVALGEREAERLRKEKERKKRKGARKEAREVEGRRLEREREMEIDTKTTYFRPVFMNAPPTVVVAEGEAMEVVVEVWMREKAGGWTVEVAEERALREFREGLGF